jgi:uncharacterized C2H2 Zn-finger protein
MFTCKSCGKQFVDEKSLDAHVGVMHGREKIKRVDEIMRTSENEEERDLKAGEFSYKKNLTKFVANISNHFRPHPQSNEPSPPPQRL